jgi:hypothetical protein
VTFAVERWKGTRWERVFRGFGGTGMGGGFLIVKLMGSCYCMMLSFMELGGVENIFDF